MNTLRDSTSARLDPLAFWLIPIGALAFQLLTYAGYGYFRDELYYLANGRHLGWGYVEHPPLIGLIAAFVERVLGTSLFAVRLLPALAHAATVAFCAAIAREMGGRRTAQVLAALAASVAPVMLGLFSIFTMNAFDLVFWSALSWIVVRYLATGNERLWLAFGVVAGIGLENKISVLFLGFGVVVGLLVSGPRVAFRRPWLWIGGALAAAIFLPHIAWQAAHGWPTLEFIRNATARKNVSLSPGAFLGAQLGNTLPAVPVWLAGLGWLLAARAARPFRAAGWAFLAVLGVMLGTNSKPYYLAPAFGVLFAAGGVALEQLGSNGLARVARGAVIGWLVATAVLAAPFAKPLMSEDAFVAYAKRLGVRPPQEERQAQARLPQTFADMHGWPELAASIGRVYQALPPGDRARACVFVQNYGEAGAIDLFGPRYGLPPAISGHNSYFLWGPGSCSGDVVIVLGGDEEDYRRGFASYQRAGTFECKDCMPYENHRPIWVCRGLRIPMKDLWPKVKDYI